MKLEDDHGLVLVVACSLTFDSKNMPDKKLLEKITDSKKIKRKKRKEIFEEFVKLSTQEKPQVYFWVWVVDNFLIDEINIRQANREAMRRSLVELLRKIDNKKIFWIFIDRSDNYVFDELEKTKLYYKLR